MSLLLLNEEKWHVDEPNGFIRDANEVQVAYVYGLSSDSEVSDEVKDHARLTARLIAAAPKLLNYLLRYRGIQCGKRCKFLKLHLDKLIDFIDGINKEDINDDAQN